MDFARGEQKASYAASFRVDTLPKSRINEYKELLKDFEAISVREEQAAKMVFELTGKMPAVVLDPTMLLEVKEWRTIEKKTKYKPRNKYALIYALGDKDF